MSPRPATSKEPVDQDGQQPSGEAEAQGGKRSRLRREVIELQVFDAAARLFAEKGYGGTTLQHIATELGISRTALYYYVSSKEELLSRIVHDLTDTGYALVSEEAAADRPSRERLRRIVEGMTRLVASNPARFRLLLQSESAMPPEIEEAHLATRRRLLVTLVEFIEDGQRSGEFRPTAARPAALAIIGMWNWTAFWVRSNHDVDEVAATFAEFAVRGLEAPAGDGAGRTPQDVLAAARGELDALALMLP